MEQSPIARDRPAAGSELQFNPPHTTEKPRERLWKRGISSLCDRDLLALMLGSGIRGKGVERLAEDLSCLLDREGGIPDLERLERIGGLGPAKASAIAAMLEYGRRRWGPCGQRIQSPVDAWPLLRHFADRKQERFICLSLNGAHEVLAVRQVTAGLVNRTLIHPREVFAEPIVDRASAILVAHNHPSGRLEASAEDIEITRRLSSTADILGIQLLDHLIFTETSYWSFLQNGQLG